MRALRTSAPGTNACIQRLASRHTTGDFVSGQGGVIYKKAGELEKKAFQGLMDDVLKPMVPLFFECVDMDDEAGRTAEYLGMQDLLGLFENPSVMDVKMVGLAERRRHLY